MTRTADISRETKETKVALARAGAPIARAEGFELHARSMEARKNGGPR